MVAIEGQDIPEHAKLKSATFSQVDPAAAKAAAGGSSNESDVGKPHVVISTKIARDYPNADGTPKKVGQTIRLGTQGLHDRRPLRHRLARCSTRRS